MRRSARDRAEPARADALVQPRELARARAGAPQPDRRGRALARFAGELEAPAALLDHALHHRQAQPGALAQLLGGEKRLEDLGQYAARNAAAGVRHAKHGIGTLGDDVVAQPTDVVGVHAAGGDGQRAGRLLSAAALLGAATVAGVLVTDHVLELPIDHDDPSSGTIEVFGREVAAPGGLDRPLLVFLQGGPGHEAPRPTGFPAGPAWLERALSADAAVVTYTRPGYGASTAPPGTAVTLGDLEGTLDYLLRKLFGEERRTEFRTHYFPFTEPSAELDIWHPGAKGGPRWIEWGGCGMVNRNVLTACGVDPDRYTGFAFGMGIDRALMFRTGVSDMRDMIEGDVRFDAQFGMEI